MPAGREGTGGQGGAREQRQNLQCGVCGRRAAAAAALAAARCTPLRAAPTSSAPAGPTGARVAGAVPALALCTRCRACIPTATAAAPSTRSPSVVSHDLRDRGAGQGARKGHVSPCTKAGCREWWLCERHRPAYSPQHAGYSVHKVHQLAEGAGVMWTMWNCGPAAQRSPWVWDRECREACAHNAAPGEANGQVCALSCKACQRTTFAAARSLFVLL